MATKQKYHFVVPCSIHKKTQQYMRKLLKRLEEDDMITGLDEGALGLLMSFHENWIKATETLDEEGLTVTDSNARGLSVHKQHPAVAIQKANAQELAKLYAQFGLTPASRKKMGKTDMGDDSPLAQFLKSNKNEPNKN